MPRLEADQFNRMALTASNRGEAWALEELLETSADPRNGVRADKALAERMVDHFTKYRMSLDIEARAVLLRHLLPDGIDAASKQDLRRVNNLVKGVDLFEHMEKIDHGLKETFYPAILLTPQCGEVLTDWEDPSWDIDRKLQYGQFLADRFCAVVGIPPIDVIAREMPPPKPGIVAGLKDTLTNTFAAATGRPPKKPENIMGFCTQRRDGRTVVALNSHDGVAFNRLEDFHATLYHELMHGVHAYFRQVVREGRYDALPGRFLPAATVMTALMDARVYAHNTRTKSDYENYAVEAHAERNALDFARAMEDPAQRMQIAARAGFKSPPIEGILNKKVF